MHAMEKILRSPSSVSSTRWIVCDCRNLGAGRARHRARGAGATADPVYAVTYLDVGTNAVAQGVDLIKKYRDASRRENANLEFTVLQEASRPNRFVIMEGWKDQGAFEAHDKGAAKSEFEGALKPIRNSPPDRHMLQPYRQRAVAGDARGRRALHGGACGFPRRRSRDRRDGRSRSSRGSPRRAKKRTAWCATTSIGSRRRASTTTRSSRHGRTPRPSMPTRPRRTRCISAARSAQGGGAWRANLYDQRLYKAALTRADALAAHVSMSRHGRA